jgi:hypothetical protein
LIGAFTAEAKVKLLSENRLSWLGELVGKGCEVNIGAAYDCDARTLGHEDFR